MGGVFEEAAVRGARLGGEIVGLLLLGFLRLLLLLGLVAEEAEGVVGEVEAAEDEDCEGDLEAGLVGGAKGGRVRGKTVSTRAWRRSNNCLRLMW